MTRYDGSDAHDALVLGWWHTLVTTGDLARTFMASLHPVGAFLAFWRSPDRPLLFRADARGLWFAGWFEPMMAGASAGLWARADYRLTRVGLSAVETFLATGLARWPVLIGVTKQEKLLRAHTRLGYTVLGEVPHLWDGERAWVVVLTSAGFDKRPARHGGT